MYAVIKTGSKQYKVNVGDTIYVEKLDKSAGDTVEFDVMMYVDGDDVQIGSPLLSDVKVSGKVIKQVKGKKIVVFKYKPKKNIRKKQGHRQPYTAVEITGMRGAAAE